MIFYKSIENIINSFLYHNGLLFKVGRYTLNDY